MKWCSESYADSTNSCAADINCLDCFAKPIFVESEKYPAGPAVEISRIVF